MHLGQHQQHAQRGAGGPWFCHQETRAGVEKHTGLTGTPRGGASLSLLAKLGRGRGWLKVFFAVAIEPP